MYSRSNWRMVPAAVVLSLATATTAWGQWSVNGVKIYYNGGNVGIGTGGPTSKLDVRGAGSRTIYGLAMAGSGTADAVYGHSKSTSGRGLVGYADAGSGFNYGVYGRSNSSKGRGVFGYAAGNAGINIGVYGRSNSTAGRGMVAYASADSGVNYGIYARSDSPDGFAGYFIGNVGVTGWMGTIDMTPLDLYANGERVFRTQWATDGLEVSPNIIGGNAANNIDAGVIGAVIGGGGSAALPNSVTANYGVIGGGFANSAGEHAFVGGGHVNDASGHGGFIGGGEDNVASGVYSAIGGGADNWAANNDCTVGGGVRNMAGNVITFDGTHATVGGGLDNLAAQHASVVGGGKFNLADGPYSTVPGGLQNVAGSDYSFAAGRRAKANHAGSFVWGDSTDADIATTADNQFIARASGGVQFVDSTGVGVELAAGGNSWAAVCDRNLKANITPLNPRDILAKLVASVPITRWNLISQDESITHIGPMAQDFYKAFGTGSNEKRITQIDADGVALAAIQGLYEMLREKEAEIADLRTEKDQETAELRARIDSLEQLMARSPTDANEDDAGFRRK